MGDIFNFDMSSFSPKLIAAIVYTVAALFAFALFPTFNGAAQEWHLEARQDGACETKSGTRFDRVVVLGGQTLAAVYAVGGANGLVALPSTEPFWGKSGEEQDPNKYDWSKGYTVDASNCQVQGMSLSVNSNAAQAETIPIKMLTANGTPVTVNAVGTVATATTAVDATVTVGNGALPQKPASMFNDNRAIINIIIGATVLIIGIGPIMILGGVGLYLLNTFSGGMTGPTKFLVGTLGAIVAVTLLGSFTDFISISYDAVDPDRFTMYEHSIASLAGTIKQFWGLIFAAGWVGLGGYFGWQAFQQYRSSRSSGGGSGSQVLG